MSMRNYSVGQRNVVGFGLLTAAMVLLGIVALVQMSKIQDALVETRDVWLLGTKALGEIQSVHAQSRADELRALLSSAVSDQQHQRDEVNQIRTSLRQPEKAYDDTIIDDVDRRNFDEYRRLAQSYQTSADAVFTAISGGQHEAALSKGLGDSEQAYTALAKHLAMMVDYNSDGAKAAGIAADDTASAARWTVIVLLVSALIFTVLTAKLLSSSVTGPLDLVVKAAERVADGDLTHSIGVDGNDELTRVQSALQRMQASLRETMQQIQGSAVQLASAAEELHAVTDGASKGIQRQNDEIQMAATAVTEMSAAVDEVARNANHTSDTSRATEGTAAAGRKQVRDTAQAIDQLAGNVVQTSESIKTLAQQASDIGRVLDVIRGIADQTNLLALNAAIEAARAGEQGRGFSVVADEVRALAQRTQASTREIEQMIASIQQGTQGAVGAMEQSNEQAQRSRALAESADDALEEITKMVSRINEMNLTIAAAAEEQAQVAREVDKNLIAIRDIASQTATGAEETSAASNELARLASSLNAMVSRFRLR
ncbi:methyl-accepting chemotaxis protein [Permianibacter sp. IMCC34836]|uniref:methyl-accepting chemotaxis protein n=1 Tax=Permianibacter fluminis TaxID=2738515 RepID=UPI001552BEB5|nr:methyl-accepting chemotaxis protein [Permianibacter fluminis]NQD35566.1 methyl-accepting chemotaxis protein [Permianibacter fluminis]